MTDFSLVRKAYEAMSTFDQLGYREENQVLYKMKDGK